MSSKSHTADLLFRWHAGERSALETILERDLPWLREYVRRRLGPILRRGGETQDYVQDAVISVLQYGPRFVVSDHDQFRALLGRIVTNMLRDEHDWLTAARRDLRREQAIPTASSVDLDCVGKTVERPSEAAAVAEERAWLRIAIELLQPEDRRAILLRDFQEKTFKEMADELGIQEDTARMRYTRALPRLAAVVRRLREGRLHALLGNEPPEVPQPPATQP
jgi:RNA polymerase sigma factor (sigma-70 family)